MLDEKLFECACLFEHFLREIHKVQEKVAPTETKPEPEEHPGQSARTADGLQKEKSKRQAKQCCNCGGNDTAAKASATAGARRGRREDVKQGALWEGGGKGVERGVGKDTSKGGYESVFKNMSAEESTRECLKVETGGSLEEMQMLSKVFFDEGTGARVRLGHTGLYKTVLRIKMDGETERPTEARVFDCCASQQPKKRHKKITDSVEMAYIAYEDEMLFDELRPIQNNRQTMGCRSGGGQSPEMLQRYIEYRKRTSSAESHKAGSMPAGMQGCSLFRNIIKQEHPCSPETQMTAHPCPPLGITGKRRSRDSHDRLAQTHFC